MILQVSAENCKYQLGVLSHGLHLDLSDLILDLFHLLLGQGIELHSDQVADQTDHDHAVSAEDNAAAQARGNGVTHNGIVVGVAAHAEHDTGDHGCERGDQLIHEAEQGAHQAGDLLAGTVDFVVGAVSGHGDNDVAGDALETGGDDSQNEVEDQEVAPVQSAGSGVGGHGGGIAQQPQGCQCAIGNQTANGTDQHCLALTQTGSKEADEQEAHDGAGDGHQTGNVTLQQVGTGDAGEHGGDNNSLVQVNLLQQDYDYRLYDVDKLARYDIYFNNVCLYEKLGIPENDLCLDIYGFHSNEKGCKYILSTKVLPYKIVKSFALNMRPIELNVMYDISGNGLYLYDTTDSNGTTQGSYHKNVVPYFLEGFNVRLLLKYVISHYRNSIKQVLKR